MRSQLAAFITLVITAIAALPGAPAAAQPTPLQWSSCGGNVECATLQVPLDYANPDGPTIGIALNRIPARDQAQRIGSLLVNPGGPGASGVDFARGFASVVASSIRDRFDIVGFDPRGVGRSDPVSCGSNLQALIAADPSPDSEAEWENLAAQNRTFAQECEQTDGDILPYVGTKNVARDMDRIREALGDSLLTYVGFSYGTVIGQVYADLFPTHVRAMVLDGAVDLSISPEELAIGQAEGFERALQAFLADCRANRCVLTQRGDPEDAVDELLRRVEQAPIPAPGADRPAGPGEALIGIVEPLYDEGGWPGLADAIDSALNGNGTGLVRLTDEYLRRNPNGSYSNLYTAFTAVSCIDNPVTLLPTRYADYPAAAAEAAKRSPHFGPAFANALACADWPAAADPLDAPTAIGAPPILVVSTSGDPATPYEWGVAVAARLPGAVLISFGGEGHTAYLGGDRCVTEAVNAYLLALTVPTANVTCGDTSAIPSAATPTPTPTATPTTEPDGSPEASPVASPSPVATGTPETPGSGTESPAGDGLAGKILLPFLAVGLMSGVLFFGYRVFQRRPWRG